MGTRCDFYVMDESKKLEWVGSYGWDGNPSGVPKDINFDKIDREDNFIYNVKTFLKEHEGYIVGKDGWPWPWDNSCTTDYTYIFYKGKIYVSNYGSKLIEYNDYLKYEEDIDDENEEVLSKIIISLDIKFPDMSKIKNVDLGKSSGTMVFGSK